MRKNYDMFDERVKTANIKSKLDVGEMILWQGSPLKKAYKVNDQGAFPIFVVIWATIDLFILSTLIFSGIFLSEPIMIPIVIGFFAIHLTPVWVFLGKIKKGKEKWLSTEYAVTDTNVIVKSGYQREVIEKFEISNIKEITLRREKLDKRLGTGDILIDMKNDVQVDILDITEYDRVFKLIKQQNADIIVSYLE